MHKLVITFAVAFVSIAPAAQAATVAVLPPSLPLLPGARVEFGAEPGEANRVELFAENDTTVRVEDPGATITPAAGCESIDAHSARCRDSAGFIGAYAFVGDLDDVVQSHALALSADGGDGNDALVGDEGFDRLTGGAGDDRLYGHGGGSLIEGGPGDDWISGGLGNDVLHGGSGMDHLFGRDGNDRLDGGSEEVNFLRGGDGADRLTSGIAQCGDGRDVVWPSTGRDRIWHDCELARNSLRVGRNHPPKWIKFRPYPTRVTGGALVFTAWCPRGEDGVLPISGQVQLTMAGGSVIGGSKIPRQAKDVCARAGASGPNPRIRIPATLNAAGRELLALPGPSEVQVAFGGVNVPPNPWTVVVR